MTQLDSALIIGTVGVSIPDKIRLYPRDVQNTSAA